MDILIGFDEAIPVDCSFEVIDNGKPTKVKFIPEFKRLSRDEAVALATEMMESIDSRAKLLTDMRSAEGEERVEMEAKAEELAIIHERQIRDHLIGWTLQGKTGQKVPFSDEAVESVMGHAVYFEALSGGLYKATGKVHKAKVKN